MRARVLVAGLATSVLVLGVAVAVAQAVPPGWECIPTVAGQAVVSGDRGGAVLWCRLHGGARADLYRLGRRR